MLSCEQDHACEVRFVDGKCFVLNEKLTPYMSVLSAFETICQSRL